MCNREDIIIYMNPEAIRRYENSGGDKLVGKSVLDCHNAHSVEVIRKVADIFAASKDINKIFTYHKDWNGADSDVYMVALRDENGEYIGYYEKHENRIHDKSETFKL